MQRKVDNSYYRLSFPNLFGMRKVFGVLCGLALFLWGCQQKSSHTLFQLMEASQTNIHFSNDLTETDSLIALSFEYLYNGSGVAIADFNRDGRSDIFFTGSMVPSKLYLNQGDWKFEDITETAEIDTRGKWSSGAVIVDINQDGWPDIYVCVGGFSTAPEKRSNLLFINQKDNTFSEEARAYGLDDTGYSINALFFDYDRDNDLDMYLLTTELDPYSWTEFRPRRLNGEAPNTDRLYRNNGDGTFTNVSREAGILIEGYGLGMGLCDLNEDGWTDLYVANDFLSNDVIYINNGDGTFTDKINDYFSHSSRNSMGTDLQDFNNDGHTDIVILDMLPESNARQKTMFGFFNYDKFKLGIERGYQPQYARNSLQLNNGNGTFSEVGQLAGVDQTDWSWSSLFADFDNDGWQDLFITNGYRQDITNMDFATYSRQLTSSPIGTMKAKEAKMFEKLRALPEIKTHNYIYQNTGTFPFTDQSTNWGFDRPSYSNGAAYADLDNDGDLDLVINNIDETAFVYQNTLYQQTQKDSSHYLRLQVRGETGNEQAIGTKVTIRYPGGSQHRMVSPYRGYLSSVENILHFGLGKAQKVHAVEITWPNGKQQKIKDLAANQLLTITYSEAETEIIPPPTTNKPPLLSEMAAAAGINFTHRENDFIDFKIQPILPHKHSQGAPGIAVGDVNGDGLEDFYVGGSAGFAGKLLLQSETGFTETSHTIETDYHDMGALLFDADNDGDLDLYVVSGGSNFQNNVTMYQDRLYQNDGQGNFTRLRGALPIIQASGASVAAADYDQDGDLDLLVTGRIIPGAYPTFAQTYLLRNDSENGRMQFTDQSKLLPENGKLGLVCQALWTDYDADGRIDLAVVGEWMPITFLRNNGKNFQDRMTVPNSAGWWNSLIGGDFDRDGDIDYIGGNLGLNSRYEASPREPVCVYAKDFDKNGRIDPVLCHYIEGENYIAHSRDMLIKQINSMRVRFKTYTDYGHTPFDRSFTKQELSDALHLKSVHFATSYLENLGDGHFELRDMPVEAQVAPIFGMLSDDFNEDGKLDVLMIGNSYATEIMVGQYDACRGLLLLGDGEGNFVSQSIQQSGFYVDKDAKALAKTLNANQEALYLATRNGETMKAFSKIGNSIYRPLPLEKNESYAIVELADGSQYREEFYFGSTYLSQSSRILAVPKTAQQITIFNSAGEKRVLKAPLDL